jgi:hypothetical protein
MFAIRVMDQSPLTVMTYIDKDGNPTRSHSNIMIFKTEDEAKEYAKNNVKMDYDVIPI